MGEWLDSALALIVQPLVSLTSRTGIAVVLAGWLIGAFAFAHHFGGGRFFPLAYLRHAFPKRVYWSQTFAVDLQVFVFVRLFSPIRLAGKVISVTLAAHWMAQGLAGLLGPATQSPPGTAASIALALTLLLAYDFGTYVTHRLSHQLPVLWAFHRLHHSAEELNPLTLMRKHPVYDLLAIMIDCVVVAPLAAGIVYLFGAQGNLAILALTNAGFAIFAYAASSLRHTHIWLSFGPLLDRVFVSPALHQIHHSRAERHFDRNFGEVLAIWDAMFGTLYQPKEREELEFGIGDEPIQPHPHLLAAMCEPFAYAWRALRRPRADAPAEMSSQAP